MKTPPSSLGNLFQSLTTLLFLSISVCAHCLSFCHFLAVVSLCSCTYTGIYVFGKYIFGIFEISTVFGILHCCKTTSVTPPSAVQKIPRNIIHCQSPACRSKFKFPPYSYISTSYCYCCKQFSPENQFYLITLLYHLRFQKP